MDYDVILVGAGAYSDGKFNITTEFGGWLTDHWKRN